MHKRLDLRNQLADIALLVDFVEELVEQLQIGQSIAFNINLALEEVVTNVISYAYPADEEHTFSVEATGVPGEEVTFVVVDSGKAFDPLTEAPEVDTTLSAEERPIGGLGIFLVKNIMDEVTYERVNEQNKLTMRKSLKE